MTVQIIHGDALHLPLADSSVDAIVCDPPYGLGFMGREWDTHDTPAAFAEWCRTWAAEALRVLKPGGHLLAFGGTRTWHRLACGIEDAGFEIRDTITWIYSSGFPKSLDVSRAIDKAAGATREVVGVGPYANRGRRTDNLVYGQATTSDDEVITAPATDDARLWRGWATALKPASEPIVVARKPLAGTVVQNVLIHGTGALNIDACRVATSDRWVATGTRSAPGSALSGSADGSLNVSVPSTHDLGRWPSNVVLSHAATPDGEDLCADGCVEGCPVRELNAQSGMTRSSVGSPRQGRRGDGWRTSHTGAEYGDTGGASRFFPTFRYQAKAPAAERPRGDDGGAHATVKPLDLMRWLVRLVTQPGGHVLDPFAGSGTTGEACLIEGFSCTLIEREAEHIELIRKRLNKPIQPTIF